MTTLFAQPETEPERPGAGMRLRPYQSIAVDAVLRELEDRISTLVVMPTGTGKTVLFAEVIQRMPPGRIMVVAHREELITQAADKIARVTGHKPDIEMASEWADQSRFQRSRVVVSSVQTQIAGMDGAGRMTRFDPQQFVLLVIDEAHHATAASYRKVIQHYRQNPELRVLGVTATPDRADEEALGQVFDSVAYDYEISDAIRDGYLVPILQRSVVVESLDLSTVRTTAGDLNGADLQAVLSREENLHGIAHPTYELARGRKTLVFADSVANAERLAEILNRHRDGCARWVCGETPKEDRRKLFADFSGGQYQFLVNVGVATEGYDEPGIEAVVLARPTKSRALFAQMVGRGTRPLPGVIDLPGLDAEGRRQAIEASAKPGVEIIDFVGNAGRHKLISVADILGGNYSDEVVARAAKKAQENPGTDVLEGLEDAQKEIDKEKEQAEARRRRSVKVKASYSTSAIDPFAAFDLRPVVQRGWDSGKTLSEKQANLLRKQGIDPERIINTYPADELLGWTAAHPTA